MLVSSSGYRPFEPSAARTPRADPARASGDVLWLPRERSAEAARRRAAVARVRRPRARSRRARRRPGRHRGRRPAPCRAGRRRPCRPAPRRRACTRSTALKRSTRSSVTPTTIEALPSARADQRHHARADLALHLVGEALQLLGRHVVERAAGELDAADILGARRRLARRRRRWRRARRASASSRSSLRRSSIRLATRAGSSRRRGLAAPAPPGAAAPPRATTCASAAAPVSASMRRTPEATALSDTILKRPISPVRRTCVPPHSSTENGRARAVDLDVLAHRDDAHLVAVFLAEQRERAFARPRGRASSGASRTSAFSRMRALTSASIARMSSGVERARMAEIEAQPVGRHQRALLRHMLAEPAAQRLVQQMRHRMIGAQACAAAPRRSAARPRRPACSAPCVTVPRWTKQIAGLLLRVAHRELAARGREHRAGVADLAAGFAVERRLVDDDRGLGRRPRPRSTALAVDDDRRDLALGDVACRSRGTRSRRTSSRSSNQSRSVAASPEPTQLLRASARWRSIAASKPSIATLRPRPRSTSSVRSSGKPKVS